MIRLTQTSDPKTIVEMVEHFVFDDERMVATFVEQLTNSMLRTPEKLLVVQARSEAKLLGFIIAEVCPDDSVWIAQAWSDPENSWSVIDNLFARVTLWALSLGKSRVRAESKRDLDALYRRFGFKDVSRIIEHKIPGGTLARLITALKEPADERTVQDT